MDALAARQLNKEKSNASLASVQRKSILSKPPLPTLKEKIELNRILGFIDPPQQVFALGKDECAAVWWTESEIETADPITGWEIHRYRRDKTKPNKDIWHHKGHVEFPPMVKNQAIINELSNDYEYRFTVKAVNIKGVGVESEPSNPVMVEKPLPTGWFRFLDAATKRHYYANVRLNKSSWERPELDPWFLDESIVLNFMPREMDALKALYTEDMEHFGYITVEQFLDVLREIGEHCSKSWIAQLFRGYSGVEHSIKTWTHFMEVINHIKQYRTKSGSWNPFECLITCVQKKKVGALLEPKAAKMGDWVIEYSALAERNFYRNSRTGESYWSMPPQVKFYIPPRLEDKLLLAFDYGDIEEFQQYFSLLDVDNSGDLSGKEIRVLLKALDIQINEYKFNKLLKTVDLNGNGTVEFDEYCWMMLQIFCKDNNSFWTEMRSKKSALSASAKNTKTAAMDLVPPPSSTNTDLSGGAGDLSAVDPSTHSQENSLFGDRAWGNKLSYSRLRNTLDAMRTFAAAGGNRQGKRKSTIFNTFRRMSHNSAAGSSRQNSFTDLENVQALPASKPLWSGWFGCSNQARKERKMSKLNVVLSQYDEHKEAHIAHAPPLYPAASFRRKSRLDSAAEVKKDDDQGTTMSVAGTTGSMKGGSMKGSSIMGSPASVNKKGRRVSFSKGNAKVAVSVAAAVATYAPAPRDEDNHSTDSFGMEEEPPPPAPQIDSPSPAATRDIPREIAMLKASHRLSVNSASGGSVTPSPVVPTDGSPGGRDIKKEIAQLKAAGRRSSVNSANSVSTLGTLGANTYTNTPNRTRAYSEASSLSSQAEERRGSRARSESHGSRGSMNGSVSTAGRSAHKRIARGKPSKEEDLSESDEDEQDEGDDTHSVGGSILKKISSFAMLSVGSGDEEKKTDPNAHPKHCMCGCRAY